MLFESCVEPVLIPESFDLVEGFLQAVLGGHRPLGESGGPGGDQELNTPSERAFGSGVHFPWEITKCHLDPLAKVLKGRRKMS